MGLTKISTGGVKDDAASQAKIADEAIDEARLQVSNAGTNAVSYTHLTLPTTPYV